MVILKRNEVQPGKVSVAELSIQNTMLSGGFGSGLHKLMMGFEGQVHHLERLSGRDIRPGNLNNILLAVRTSVYGWRTFPDVCLIYG